MPPLSERLRGSLEGFAAMDNLPKASHPPINNAGMGPGGNPYIRCPIPPLNAGPDTLRQFNESGKIPTRRVIPLPAQTATGGSGSVTNNNTTIIQQGGGSSSTTPSLAAASVSFTYPALIPGQVLLAQVSMAKSFQLLQLTATGPIEVRMYADAGTQGADAPRETDSAVAFEVVPGIITDVVFDSAPFIWNWQNRIAANADSPETKLIYITIINPSGIGADAGVVTIGYLPLES